MHYHQYFSAKSIFPDFPGNAKTFSRESGKLNSREFPGNRELGIPGNKHYLTARLGNSPKQSNIKELQQGHTYKVTYFCP